MRRAYALAAAGSLAAVALWRHDLTRQAWLVTTRQLQASPLARALVIGEVILLILILGAAVRAISDRPNPSFDIPALLIGCAVGWVLEAWGTRLRIYSYYTGETPPHWIALAWGLGAIMIERLSGRARSRYGLAPALAYWLLAALCAGVPVVLLSPWLTTAKGWAGLVIYVLCLVLGARPGEDFWRLATGLTCVFFADLWGTTNGCWTYDLTIRAHGPWAGILLGMTFDAGVALGTLRLALFFNRRFA